MRSLTGLRPKPVAKTCARQVGRKGLRQDRDLVVMPDQSPPGFGGGAGLASADQTCAGNLFQRPDPLRNGRRGDPKLGCCKIEGTAAMHGGKGRQMGWIWYQLI